MKRVFVLMLVIALLAGCGARARSAEPADPPPAADDADAPAGDLMAGVEAKAPDAQAELDGETADAVADLGVRLFQACLSGGNTLVSPLSVIEALGMAANGAAGETLAQLEDAFGTDLETLNAWLYAYVRSLPDTEGTSVHVANGIWLNAGGGLTVEPGFLETNGTYYNAGIYEEDFAPALADEINAWVEEHTAGRIDRIVDQVSGDAMSYLVNALSFDGVWREIYREDQIRPGTFTTADGQEQDAELMWSTEMAFLQDEHAKGFVKYYDGMDCAFVAMLPEEGMAVEDYAATLTGAGIRRMLAEVRSDVPVTAAVPKFSAEYGTELSRTLADMGVTDAFDSEKADFSRMGVCEGGNLYVDRVLHKTFINVDENGTQAGAATAIEVRSAGLMGPGEQVVLDRPFVYMLVDCAANVPIFIGTVASLV